MTTLPVGLQWARVPNRLPVVGYFWRLFTSVRFALLLIAVLAIGCFLGVIISQVPIDLSDSPADFANWVEQQARPRYGTFTNVMFLLGLYDVFHTPWFRASLILLTVAIVVCTLNRFPAIYQTTVKAKPTVPEGFLRAAKFRGEVDVENAGPALEAELKRRGYHITRTVEGAKLHLYADKNGWAKYMTFVSHLGLLLFMLGGMLTNVEGYQRFLVIPDGQSMPVYSVYHPEQMQVLNRGFTVEYYPDGRPSEDAKADADRRPHRMPVGKPRGDVCGEPNSCEQQQNSDRRVAQPAAAPQRPRRGGGLGRLRGLREAARPPARGAAPAADPAATGRGNPGP